jgi:hypothetical protein
VRERWCPGDPWDSFSYQPRCSAPEPRSPPPTTRREPLLLHCKHFWELTLRKTRLANERCVKLLMTIYVRVPAQARLGREVAFHRALLRRCRRPDQGEGVPTSAQKPGQIRWPSIAALPPACMGQLASLSIFLIAWADLTMKLTASSLEGRRSLQDGAQRRRPADRAGGGAATAGLRPRPGLAARARGVYGHNSYTVLATVDCSGVSGAVYAAFLRIAAVGPYIKGGGPYTPI